MLTRRADGNISSEATTQPGNICPEAMRTPLAILNATIAGAKGQPSSGELRNLGRRLLAGEKWEGVFAGVASIDISPQGEGPTLSLRIAKKEGIPIQLVPEGTPGATVVAVKRVDELGYYSLGAADLASKCSVSTADVVTAVDYLRLRTESECYKEIRIGKSVFKRYSPASIAKIRAALSEKTAGAMRAEIKRRRAV